KEIRGQSAEARCLARQSRSKPIVDDLKPWLEEQLRKVSGRSPMAEAIRYVLTQWNGLTLFLDDGRIEIDNNCIERNMRPIAVTCSLCTLPLSVCKHWKLIFRIGATRASFSLGHRYRNSLVAQIVGTYLVRRARYDLFGGKDTVLNKPADNVIGHAKQFCGFTH